MPFIRPQSRSQAPHPLRALLVAFLSMLVAGCAETKPVQEPEGSVAFRAGTGETSGNRTHLTPGPAFQHPGILVPASDPIWQSTWLSKDQENSLTQGATSGLLTGISIMQVAPFALTFWPAAVGIVVGAVGMGMLGVVPEDPALQRISPPDRATIAEATKTLRPDRLFRDAMAEALARRGGGPLSAVDWHQAWGPDTPGTDPLIEARNKGLDGVLEFSLDAIGLAVGEEADTFGVFVQVRVRALDAPGGQLRYERVLSYGPGQHMEGLPRLDFYTVEFLAADKGHPYRHFASEAIRRLARLLADDPALPLAPQRNSK
ncbi:MAG: hypothetical protein NTW68_08070 [candidate division NC10 bacterium]|nr:hypothetical protein [candidate division NC10 bacterium]